MARRIRPDAKTAFRVLRNRKTRTAFVQTRRNTLANRETQAAIPRRMLSDATTTRVRLRIPWDTSVRLRGGPALLKPFGEKVARLSRQHALWQIDKHKNGFRPDRSAQALDVTERAHAIQYLGMIGGRQDAVPALTRPAG